MEEYRPMIGDPRHEVRLAVDGFGLCVNDLGELCPTDPEWRPFGQLPPPWPDDGGDGRLRQFGAPKIIKLSPTAERVQWPAATPGNRYTIEPHSYSFRLGEEERQVWAGYSHMLNTWVFRAETVTTI